MTAKERDWFKWLVGLFLPMIFSAQMYQNHLVSKMLEDHTTLKTEFHDYKTSNDKGNDRRDNDIAEMKQYFYLRPDDIELKHKNIPQ